MYVFFIVLTLFLDVYGFFSRLWLPPDFFNIGVLKSVDLFRALFGLDEAKDISETLALW